MACRKCHITFAKSRELSPKGNRYDQDEMNLCGIDCEKIAKDRLAKHVITIGES